MPAPFDVAVVGAGAVGAAAALALARDGFSTCLVGRPEMRPDGRTVALLDGSVRFLEALGAWPGLRERAAPLVTMRIIDDSGSLFRPPPVAFQASEIDLEAFGWNIENTVLVGGLIEAARAEPRLQLASEDAGKTTFGEDVATIALSDGSTVATRLVVAADGRNSRLRETAGIAARSWSYPQSALTTHLCARTRPPRRLDRVPHPLRPLHAGADGGPTLEPRLGDQPSSCRAPDEARRY